jgi:parallel beta-helix repeat protein
VPNGLSLSLPILKKPSSVMNVMLGRDVDLLKLDLPPLELDFSIEEDFPVFGPIAAHFEGRIEIDADLAVGYDTVGLRKFKESGFANRTVLADGFFIYDRVDSQGQPAQEGTDADELTLTASITAGPAFDVPGFQILVGGDLTAAIRLDLPDGDQTVLADGRSRFGELANCGINVEGDLTAGLGVRVVLEIPFAPDITLFKKNLARATLLDFKSGCVVPTPLATLAGGVLTLNVGASQDEKVAISAAKDKNGQDVVRVQMFGVAEDFPRAQVQRIAASFGGGDDSIHIDPELAIPAQVFGGAGRDQLTGGGGDDTMHGDGGDDQLSGGPGGDFLFGDADNDQIDGDEGNDEIYGNSGDDGLSGGAGDDYLQGNAGNDELFGGDGIDNLFGDHELDDTQRGDDNVQGGVGNDILTGGPGIDVVLGGEGNDLARGDTVSGVVPACVPACPANANDDLILGDAGIDTLEGGAGADVLQGGAENDFLYGQSVAGAGDDGRADQLFGEDGDDQLFGQNGADVLQGDAGNDELFGGADADLLRGLAGSDQLHGGSGADQLFGGENDDLLEGDAGADLLHGDQREDRLFGHSQSAAGDDAAADTLFGDQGVDTLDGDAGNDALHGGTESDLLSGDVGDDVLEGDAGIDQLHGNAGNDSLFGHSVSGAGDDAAADELFGETGGDTLHGNAGDDLLHGDADADALYGDAGSDVVEGNSGADFLSGGAGADRLFGHSLLGGGDDNAVDTLYGDYGTGHPLGTSGDPLAAGRDELFGQGGNDDLHGEQLTDELYGGSGDDTMHGDGGDDYLDGAAGADQLFGDAENDRIHGRGGADSIHGGSGDDLLYGEVGGDEIHGDAGADQLFGDEDEDVLHGGSGNDSVFAGAGIVNRLFGEEDDDRLIGSDEGIDDPNLLDAVFFGDIFAGGPGDDEIFGLGGSDVIDGDAGDDWVDGGARGDLIRGGTGRDRLYGATGNDRLEGGDDNDELYGETGSDAMGGDAGDDFLDGGVEADMLFGGTGNDEIRGGGGAGDQLFGEDGSDVLHGSDDGADMMQGDAGRDRLMGAGGNDALRGGSDDDVLLGGPGDDLLEGEAGSDTVAGEGNHDTLFGHTVAGIGDDNGVDFLYGDFATGDDETGSGRDRLFGGGGNDFLLGEADDDFLDAGAGTSDVLDFGGGDGATPNNFAPPTPTAPPIVLPHVPHERTAASLPAGATGRGRWQQFAGSASGLGVGGNVAGAFDPAIVAGPSGTFYAAWSDARNGNYEIYVSRWNGSAWEGLADSDRHGGISRSESSSQRPSITLGAGGQPIVAWRENGDIFVAAFDPAAQGGLGAWVGLANSLGPGGISGSGTADRPSIANTSSGPVVAWLNYAGDASEIRVQRFNGAAWTAVGAPVVAGAADLGELQLATDGVKLAVGWRQSVAGVSRVYVRENTGAAWNELAGSASGAGISPSTLSADQPTLAYHDGELYVAWRQFTRTESGESEVYAARFSGTAWEEAGTGGQSGGGVSATGGTASIPRLAAGGGTLHLTWGEDLLASGVSSRTVIYAKRWDGVAFAERFNQSGDVTGGISSTGDGVRSISVAVNSTGQPLVSWANSEPGSPQIFVRGDMLAVNRVMYTSGGVTLADVLALNMIAPGDVVVVAPGGQTASATLTSAHSGIYITGSGEEFSQINGLVTVDGADHVTFSNINLAGGLVATQTEGLHIVSSQVGGNGLLLDGTQNSVVSNNHIESPAIGLTLRGNTGTAIEHNFIHGATAGLRIDGVETATQIARNSVSSNATALQIAANLAGGAIEDNEIRNSALGVEYAAAAQLVGNRIHHNTTGVRVAASQVATGLGYVGARGANDIFANTTGVDLLGRMRDQTVRDNTTGVVGAGVLGPASLDEANLIHSNTTGVHFNGTIQFNRIRDNTTGVRARGNSQIHHNVISGNQVVGVSASGVTDVQIANNTFYAAAGDNIRVENAAREVEVRGNLLWVDQGTNVFVSDNSREGFFSDYNQLHATGTGKLVHWMRDFADVLDWQVDVNRFDLHSIGRTAVNPLGAEPALVSMARGDFRLWNLVGASRRTNPSVDGADPRIDVGVPLSMVNLLSNPSFEAATAGWTTNVQGTAGAPNFTPFHGAAYYVPGAVATGVAQQTVDLIAAGHSAAQLDSQNLVVVFGGRVRSRADAPIDTATITIEVRDAGGQILAAQTRGAANVADRWDLIGDRIAMPVGARQITYRFEAIRASGLANDSHLDGAFVYILSEAIAPDFGAYGHSDEELASAGPHLAVRFPDLYLDWQRDAAKTLRWQSYDNSANSPVRIDLLQDGVHGPQVVTTIAASTPDDGELIWIPGNSGVNFDTPGLRIQVSLVNDAMTLDRAQEAFTVPDDSTTFFVDDASNSNDEYTLGATGNNRNTGKRVDAPKPHPINLLRAYDLPAAAVVSVDTGVYPLFDAVRISGSQDLGLGLEEAFLLRGPTDTAKDVTLSWIFPDGHPQALVELTDADFMTLSNLDLIGSPRGLFVAGGSDNFSASHITARNQTLDAIDITPLNPAANFVGLVAENAARHGIVITGEFASLSDGRAVNSLDTGIKLSASANARIEAMEVFGNRIGIDINNSVAGTRTVVGNEDLSLGRGNKVFSNSQFGILGSSSLLIAGNVVHGHTSTFNGAIFVNGTGSEVARNIVFNNQRGIQVNGSGPVRENRVYGNTNTGIHADGNVPILANVVYSNPTGINTSGNSSLVANNLIYANATNGLRIGGGSPDAVNNTVFSTAGNGIRAEAGVTGLELRNNIVWAAGGVGLSIANDSQVGLASDFNLLFSSGAGILGNWLGFNQTTLQQWQLATGKDVNSLSNDPLFVDFDGGDDVLGFLGASDGSDDDFHLQSPFGSLHGGSLAPFRSATTGLPVFPVGTLTNDASLSPAIDRGAATDVFANEPAPNGGFINIGHDGNTAQASRSPSPLLLMLDPNGGEIVAHGSTFPIRWRASGFVGNVLLEVSSTGPSGPFSVLAASEPNDGAFDWLVVPATFPASPTYFLRISSVDQPAVFDISDAAFQVTVPNTTYFVNDASTVGDEYTTAVGSAANTGLTPASPMASIQAVLNTYDLAPGDVIFVDTGAYSITANIIIDAADSGVRIQGPVQGTHLASLNRNNTAGGSFVIQLQNATGVTLDSLEIFGANEGVLVNMASHDFTITNSIVRNNFVRGVHIEETANRAVVAENDIRNIEGFPPIAIEIEGDDAIVRNNTIRNNFQGISVTQTAANTLIRENDLFGNGIAINANQSSSVPSGLRIEANSVHGNSANSAVVLIGAGLLIDNEVFSNSTIIAIEANGAFVEVRGNRVFGHTSPVNNPRGLRVSGGALARDNVVFGNTTGIETSASSVFDNIVYSNGTGILTGGSPTAIANNLIYGNSLAGIDQGVSAVSSLLNNTIYQLTGDAIRAAQASGTLAATNNIFVVGTGSAFNIAAQNQANFSSDYNLFHMIGAGRVATWGATPFTTWEDWQFGTPHDRHSIVADPLLVDPDGADNTLGSDDDDFHLASGSPAANAGHPLSIYSGESASGNMADLGAYGNRAASLPSATQRLQLVEPTTYRKVELGQPVEVRWVAAGLTNFAPVVLLDSGGPGAFDVASGRWSAEAYRTVSTQQTMFAQAVDVSAVTNPPPQSVLQSFAQASNAGIGQIMRYDVPLVDGSYQIRLFFAEPSFGGPNGRKFDVTLQGQIVVSNLDIFAEAGAIRKAVVKSFNFTASQGNGLRLEFTNRTTINASIVNAFEITRVDVAAPASFAVNLDFSADQGQSWSTIATNLASNRFGEGSFSWTADQTTQGHTGLFRATAVGSGLANVNYATTRPISVSPSTNSFYINVAGDANFADNEYTTAAGSELNSGTSPSSPMASLAVLLQNYPLSPGDTVFVDTGNYSIANNIELTAAHSGVRIQGPVAGTHAAVFNRGNLNTGSFVFHLQDAANVTLDSLELVGGIDGLLVAGASHDMTLSNSVVRNNQIGIHVDTVASRAVVTNNEIFANSGAGSFQAAVNIEGDNALVSNNVIRNNAMAGINIGFPAQNAVIRGNDIFGNTHFAINANGTNDLIEQNSIHGNASLGFPAAVSVRVGTIQDNQIFGNNSPGITLIQTGGVAQRNVIHGNTDGITASGSGVVIRDNRVFHNSQVGIRLTGQTALVSDNTIYANATGVLLSINFNFDATTIRNNVIYDHSSVGVEINDVSTLNSPIVNIHNNTFLEMTSTAVRLTSGPRVDVRNNILSTATGTLFSVAAVAQPGFTSDYNLLHVAGGGKVGVWGTDNIVGRADWYFELGRDEHSLEADPQFIDIDGPDGIRGYHVSTGTDRGADDDFRELIESPAIDAGDPLSYYSREPFSGNRINIGAFGNTSRATQSLPLVIQLTQPSGLSKFELGQPIELRWISNGFTNTRPVALIDAGGVGVFDPSNGRWSGEAFRTGGTTSRVTGAIDTSLVANPPPLSVLQTLASGQPGTTGTVTRYNVPLADGSYNVRLLFLEPNDSSGPNQRLFDVTLQGQTVLANFDIFAVAGSVRKATARSFAFTASQGTGLRLELINRTTSNPAVLAGIEITAANPSAPASPVANLDFSPDNGANWTTIATNLPTSRFGEGSFVWNATTTTNGNTGRFRVTAVSDGVPSVQSVSNAVSIANAGNSYFINVAGDPTLADNEYTTASGDNLNAGKSPAAPMKSLAALVRAYDLDAGDTVFVDTGSYKLLSNVEFHAVDSGARIQGPTTAGHVASLDRANTAIGNYGLAFLAGSSGITVDSLEVLGGEVGLITGSGASNIDLRNSVIRNNSYAGIYLEVGSSNTRILNNQIQENTSRGVEVRGSQVTIENNLIRNSDRGVIVTCCNSAEVTIRNNDIFGHNVGVELSTVALGLHLVQGNKVHDNAQTGILSGVGGTATGQIIGNEVFGHSGANDIGINVTGVNTLVRDNVIHHNFKGIEVASSATTVERNRVYFNSSVGINITSFDRLDIVANQVYSNATGIVSNPSFAVAFPIRNNLIYSNTNIAIDVPSGIPTIAGNTIYHPVGTAVRYTGAGSGVFKSNIVQGDVGTLVIVAVGGQAAFDSNHNLLFPTTGAANVGQWGAVTAATLANWQTVSARDAGSVSADPLFLDMGGADNVLGGPGVPEGDGEDDNFHLRRGSPAIDRGDSWTWSILDKEGSDRRDDAGTPNAGGPMYVEGSMGASSFAATGTAQNHRQDDSFFNLTFTGGFTFPFYGTPFASVFVSTNGFLVFGTNANATDPTNTTAEHLTRKIIAPLWDSLTTLGPGDDVFVDTATTGRVTIRWNATNTAGNSDAQFAVTLINTGEIQFHYGPGLTGLTPTIGISAGDGVNFDFAQYDGRATLTSAASLAYTFAPGFVDIGAYEFLGSSLDTTPPVLLESVIHTHVTPAGAASEIHVTFSEPIDSIDAHSPANYQLLEDGADGIFDNSDDVAYPLIPQHAVGSAEVKLDVAAPGGLPVFGNYRFRVSGTTSIHDVSGNRLDGDNDGQPGGDSIGTNSAPQLPVIADRQVDENEPLSFLVTGTDANSGDVLSYSLGTGAPMGASIDAATGLFTWTPIDGDGPGIYSIVVTVTDNGSPSLNASTHFSVTVNDVAPASIVGRHVFYNNSAFDGNDPLANAADDAAIPAGKQPLMPGHTATPANYTSYSRGLNGVIVDVADLAGVPTAGDFEFRVGNSDDPSAWAIAPAPQIIGVRGGAGQGGSDRVTITWQDGAIVNQWLRVKVLSDASGGALGLANDHEFYFGNAIGETGNLAGDFRVDLADKLLVLQNASPAVGVENPYDINRDGRVDAQDSTAVESSFNALPGDFDRDDAVGAGDLSVVQLHLGMPPTASYYDGDISGDRLVTRVDVALLAMQVGQTVTAAMLAARLRPISTPAPSPQAAASAQSFELSLSRNGKSDDAGTAASRMYFATKRDGRDEQLVPIPVRIVVAVAPAVRREAVDAVMATHEAPKRSLTARRRTQVNLLGGGPTLPRIVDPDTPM